MTSMVHGLICQLVQQIPGEIEVDQPGADLQELFERLDGSPESIPVAIKLLEELLSFAPPLLFCIIDGLHWLDDRSTTPYVTALLAALREGGGGPSASREDLVLKWFFTTSGRSEALLTGLDDSEIFFISNNRRATHSPGMLRANRTQLDVSTPQPSPLRGKET